MKISMDVDEVASSLAGGKAILEELYGNLGPLPSALFVVAAISATYTFVRLRKSRVESLNDIQA
jgi:hypothetical protein